MAGNGPPNAEAKGKGKGKETSTDVGRAIGSQNTESAATTNDAPSVFSRIAQSAASLGRDMVSARPSGGDLASLTSADKGGQAGRGQPSAATAAGEGSASAAFPSWATPRSGSSHAQQHATAQDEAFSQFLDGTSIDMSMHTEPIVGLDNAVMEEAWSQKTTWPPQTQSTEVQASTNTQWQNQPPPSAVAEQERHDGLDVVNLLAVDGPAEEEPNYGDIELAEDEITALKRALFGDRNSEQQYSSTTTSNDWDTVLNFIPDFVRPSSGGGYEEEPSSAQFGTAAPTKSRETQAALGLTHSSESTRQWLDQWHGVLTRYDDEVWGGLSPLVAQAREEVDQLQQSEADTSPADQQPASTTALDRLRQILGHLRED